MPREQAARLVAQYHDDPQAERNVVWWHAREVAQLPVEQRDVLREASAIVAEDEYLTNPN